ncbi:MAG: AAA family ATPase, partial [Candidatus Accumulibacter sp.]|uniref:AAA family ATPase n=1 Tax=Accumulibacter sp. TaxID=2053492 RepID=UPI001ACFD7D6
MSDFQEQYTLWEEFLSVWPVSRLATMTLDEYSLAGSKDSFTYWIESGLDKLGSIWGGSAFKFGVFSRKDTEDKKSDAKLSYSDSHGWYSSLGSTAEDAFEKVRGYVVQVATLAAQGDLDGIEALPLGEAFKWKIAFHYQNRQSPVVVDIFKRAPLAVFAGGTASQSMAVLQKSALAKRPANLGILEFGRQVWEAWSDKNLAIWKLSHGNPPNFTEAERQQYLEGLWAVMHRDTGKEQGKKFAEAPVGTLFFLCHGNSPQRIGQFTSEAMPCDKGDGWLKRSYRVLKPAKRTDRYTANSKNWSPQGNSTFWQVGANDLPEFENTLLKPFFATDLAELAALAGEPIEATTLATTTAGISAPAPSSDANHVPVVGCTNRIYYGPPGTGKTKAVLDLLKANYTDAPQQIDSPERQRQAIAERMATARWWEAAAAALHDLGGQAKVSDLAEHRFVQAMVATTGTNRSIKQTLWRTLQTYTVEESATVRLKKRLSPSIFDKGDDSVWRFAGEWQEACADLIEWVDALKKGGSNAVERKRYRFVTFHQSYGYEEFIEGLRPVLATDSEAEADSVAYEMRAGVFKELCREARLSPGQRFALVIDEINRGNISKIFGELITLIEADKRDPLDGTSPPAEVTLAYSGDKVISANPYTKQAGRIKMSHLGRSGFRSSLDSTACMASLPRE